jgi:murein DD-endopeptidase MepM/ murein hydrolase activator NlpD
MNEKKSFTEKLDSFFAGKGFYIVLILCVAIIGVSTYFLLTNRGTDVEAGLEEPVPPRSSEELSTQPSEEVVLPIETEPITEGNEPGSEDTAQEAPPAEEDVWTEAGTEPVSGSQFIWPLDGEITLPYSVTSLIYNERMGDWRTSDCVNIAAKLGSQVVAVAAGTVKTVTVDDINGTTVTIEHSGGLTSIYSNLATVPTVYEGDTVMTGEVIGSVGTTAVGTSPEKTHLYFKMTLDGLSVDPGEYLPPR